MVLMMMNVPVHAAANDTAFQDADMAAHDYIMDKQAAYGCSMVQMSDEELSEVTAAGFSSFTLTGGVARAFFNIEARTFAEIDSLKMGYYSTDGGTTYGWDQDWTNVSLGSASEDLILRGVYIEANFSNITDDATRQLESLRVGTPSMTGPISATFNSFSGHIENPVDGVLVDGKRLNLGTRTIYSTDSEFYMQLSRTGGQAGWWFYWNNATITP
jgi:hypothetical protein